MGSLGGLIASRIAREFRIGGPSFTVSCDETSGIQALAIAVDWLRRGELDAAIVGAVDFAGDIRAVLAQTPTPARAGRCTPGPIPSPATGPSALVLKRLDDAERDGDRIYAIIRGQSGREVGIGSARPGWRLQPGIDRSATLVTRARVTGLATVAKTALCLAQQILPLAERPAILAAGIGRKDPAARRSAHRAWAAITSS